MTYIPFADFLPFFKQFRDSLKLDFSHYRLSISRIGDSLSPSISAEHATECTFFLKSADEQFAVPPLTEGYLTINDAQSALDKLLEPLLS